MTLVSYSTGPGAASGGVPNSQTVAAAKQLLDAAKQSRDEVNLALTPVPPPPKKSGWDYALDITMGVPQTGGGVAMMWLTGWTGIGAVAGGAMALDGAVRLGHSISDAVNGTVTDAPISAGLQKLGMSRRWANTADTGVGLLVTVPAGGYGAYTGLVKGGMALKTASGIGLLTMTDSTAAAGRYMITGEAAHPFAVEGLTAAGLTPTQANYVVFGGNLLLGAGALKGLRQARSEGAPATAATTGTSKKPSTVATTTATTSNKVISISGLRGPWKPANATATADPASSPTSIPTLATGRPVGGTAGVPGGPATAGTHGPVTTVTAPGTRQYVMVRVGNTVALDETLGSANQSTRQTGNPSGNTRRVYRDGQWQTVPAKPPGATSSSGTSTLFVPDTVKGPEVVIVGNGNVAMTLAVDLDLYWGRPMTVLMRPRGPDRIGTYIGDYTYLESLRKTWNQTHLDRPLFGYLGTDEGVSMMRHAKTVVVSIPDEPLVRLAFFKMLQQKELVSDPSKTFVLIRGGQAGQPALSKIIHDDPNWRASVVLVEDSPYGTRVFHGPQKQALLNEENVPILDQQGNPILLGEQQHYIQGKRKEEVEISVLGEGGSRMPGAAATRDIFPLGHQIGKPSWPDFVVVDAVAMPWRFGHAVHPGVAFHPANLQKTFAGEQYLHYSQGVNIEVAELLTTLDQEKLLLADAYRTTAETFPMKLNRQFGLKLIPGESMFDTMQRTIEQAHIPDSKKIYTSKSYPSIEALMNSRYPLEDVPGVFTMNWYAKRAGIELPGHAQYEASLRATLRELCEYLGRDPDAFAQKTDGYIPILNQIPGGVPEITQLLNVPHIRSAGAGG